MNNHTLAALLETEKIDLLQYLKEQVSELETDTDDSYHDLSISDLALREVLKHLPILIFIVDTKFRISEIHGQAIPHVIPEIEIDMVIGQSAKDVFTHIPAIPYDIGCALTGNSINNTTKLGEAAFRAYYQPICRGEKFVGVVAVLTDIRELMAKNDALHDSETRLKAIFDQTQQFTSLLQSNGHILEINRTALEFAGLRRQDVLGQPLWKMAWWQLGSCAAKLEEAFQQSLTGKTIHYETQVWGKDNVVATIDMTLKPIMNHKNQATMVLAEGHNITERKVAEQQMRAALEKEKELSDLKSRFITFTSHEFRTPLAIISSSAYLLRRRGLGLSNEVQERHFAKIQNNIDQIAKILDDILLVGCLNSQQIGYQPQAYPVSQVVDLLLKEYEKRFGNTHTFSFQSTPPDIHIQADQTFLEQAINQLLKNAVIYATVRGKIQVVLSLDNNLFTIQVTDNGVGIPSEDTEKIFDSFVRGSNVDNFPGTGLGLAIVKDVVELHSGTIAVQSQPGKTIFTLTIPQNT